MPGVVIRCAGLKCTLKELNTGDFPVNDWGISAALKNKDHILGGQDL